MATVTKVSVTKYSASSSGASSIIGYADGVCRTYVVEFTVDSSATEIGVKIFGSNYNNTYRACNIYGKVGTSKTEWLNHTGTDGTLIGTVNKGVAKDTNFTWNATISGLRLIPGQTYYLTLYHYTNSYAAVYVENSGITLPSFLRHRVN